MTCRGHWRRNSRVNRQARAAPFPFSIKDKKEALLILAI